MCAHCEPRSAPHARRRLILSPTGAKHVTVLGARELAAVDSPENLALLQQARGIWFGGGRQWRSSMRTRTRGPWSSMRDVLRRGGVIGGSSAGATIQGDYLAAAAHSARTL